MNSMRPFVFGALTTFAIAGALFGNVAIAQPAQQKQQSTHLITIPFSDSTHAISADLIDQIGAYDLGDGVFEVSIISVNDYTGESDELLKVNMKKSAVDDLIKEVNKYRN